MLYGAAGDRIVPYKDRLGVAKAALDGTSCCASPSCAELAYYAADKDYLPVEKLARRCETLSLLLRAAAGDLR